MAEHVEGKNEFGSAKPSLFEGYKFDEKRISDLFQKLDTNRDGRIDATELSEGIKKLGFHYSPGQAEVIIELGDDTDDDHLSFDEFLKYCHDHEQKLWLVFKSIDTSNTGTVSRDELRNAFKNLGVKVSEHEVDTLINKMDKDGTLQIDWDEWREFHFLNPNAHNMVDIIKFWKHSTFIDIGADFSVPDDFTEEEKKTGMWWRQLVSGGVAGVVSRSCTAPLDRLKVLLQVHSDSKGDWGIRQGFQKMLSEGGFRSLWRGNMVNCIKIAPESAIKFFAYEHTKKLFNSGDTKQLRVYERFIAGSAAGICSQTSIYPMEVLKTRLALGKTGQYSGLVDCARKVFKQDGVRVFYRGLTPGLIGVIPYAGIDLCVYETLKVKWLNRHIEKTDPGVLVLLFCGTVSSTCGQLASYPLALIRTKLQAQTTDPNFRGLRANGMRDMFKLIVEENGYLGLYRGLLPNFLKVAPAVSISYVVYEYMRKLLGMT
ncbi:mitochondrial adenyl nucleotide antiporter SLC25A24-B-like [Hydractinia symbiolongicarpus]|uniref:mitochondrial adenyl nucleotide antiporter SLC25A24-B-like n=1 Tax=Hydractinia symbiolongicarpus TaxID=13093 RepID=UPI00254FDAEB|nr:mitochondrial adenyl nucleotide antiporter SLC25A24-B-like [Hydractinia symbiolongicarpus]